MTSGSGIGGRLDASYPVDLRNGGGIGVTKQGLAARIAIDLRQTQRLTTIPAGGLVPVQDPVTGLVGGLPVAALPVAQTGDGSQTNAKLAVMPARTFKANLLSTTAPPQDVNFAQVLEALGITSGGSVATNAANVSVVPPANQGYTNVQGAITSIEAGKLTKAQNLADLTDKAAARSALGLATATTTATLSGLSSALSGISVSADPLPAWATWKANNDSFLVNANGAPTYIWPGGGDYACVSAITGALRLPVEAGDNNINGGPAIIIASGVMGLALTDCLNNVAVGGYFSGGISLDQGRGWGINATLANGDRRGLGGYVGKNGQLITAEIDLNLNTPPGGWSGTNAYAISAVCVAQSQPDGGFTALHISAIDINNASTGRANFPKVGWKEAIRTDPGACNEFAQIHTIKYPGDGASGSQQLHFISSPATNQFRHGYIQLAPDGGFVVQPDYFAGQGAFTVANSNLSQACTIHPVSGFAGPRISVSGNVSAGGDGGFSGNLAVGGLVQTQLLSVQGNATLNGNVTANNDITMTGGLLTTTRIRFNNRDVQVGSEGPNGVPNGFKPLMIAV